MITTKQKWISILLLTGFLLLFVGFGFFSYSDSVISPDIESIGELEDQKLGGVISKMPDNSAKIFFESLLGEKLSGYQSFDNVYATLSALRKNQIQAAWFADVTAHYLSQTQDGLRLIETQDPSQARFEFAMAVRAKDNQLRDELNAAISLLRANGRLDELITSYIVDAPNAVRKDKISEYSGKGAPLYIGVTGAVPPVDMVDTNFSPYGFNVALSSELQELIHRKIVLVVVQNDTAFSDLMAGKIDVLFAYGTSPDTVGVTKSYVMTEGYYKIMKYSYLVLE